MNNDLISRSELKKVFGYTDEWYKGRTVCAIIDNAPTVEERPQGEWIKDENGIDRCSICFEKCQTFVMGKPRDKFCINCGAKMEVK